MSKLGASTAGTVHLAEERMIEGERKLAQMCGIGRGQGYWLFEVTAEQIEEIGYRKCRKCFH